jgi:hypothetical protein
MAESESENEMQKLNQPEAADDGDSVQTQSSMNNEDQNKEEIQKLRSLVLINIAATTIVLLLLVAFLATYLIQDGKKDEDYTCDCECLYEFPQNVNPATPAPTAAAGNIFDQTSTTDPPQEALELNITSPSTLAPTIIEGRSVFTTNEELRQAVKDAEAAGYDPSAEVFAEYGYPMGRW